jgi:hypothetical protein
MQPSATSSNLANRFTPGYLPEYSTHDNESLSSPDSPVNEYNNVSDSRLSLLSRLTDTTTGVSVSPPRRLLDRIGDFTYNGSRLAPDNSNEIPFGDEPDTPVDRFASPTPHWTDAEEVNASELQQGNDWEHVSRVVYV